MKINQPHLIFCLHLFNLFLKSACFLLFVFNSAKRKSLSKENKVTKADPVAKHLITNIMGRYKRLILYPLLVTIL